MNGILYDARKVKVYECLCRLGEYAGTPVEWCNGLWADLLNDREVYDEFVYYLEHHCFADKVKFCGYGLTDMFVWQMDRYNLFHDSGKNTDKCNKEWMALRAFSTMLNMKKDPDTYRRRLEEGPGMDRMF